MVTLRGFNLGTWHWQSLRRAFTFPSECKEKGRRDRPWDGAEVAFLVSAVWTSNTCYSPALWVGVRHQ